MPRRMIGAAQLNAATFEEVENDRNTTAQAVLVVVLVSFAAFVGQIFTLGDTPAPAIWLGVGLLTLAAGIGGWAVLAFLIFMVGTWSLGTPQTQATW